MDPTLVFHDFDPVTGPPTIDGNTGIEDVGASYPTPLDPGYTGGSSVTLASVWPGTGPDIDTSGVPLPAVIVKAVRNGEFIDLAIFCRFDQSFDDDDVVVLAIRPSVTQGKQSACRRFDIYPVYEAVGANGPPPIGGNNTGHQPKNVEYYVGKDPGPAGGAPWSNAGSLPVGVSIGVRHWSGHPNNDGHDNAWSMEVRLPIKAGADWIDLPGQFGLYLNVIRVGAGLPSIYDLTAVEYVFGKQTAITGNLDATTKIEQDYYGVGVLPGELGAPANAGVGVSLVTGPGNPNGVLSVGNRLVKVGGTGPGSGAPGGWISTSGQDNVLVAKVINTDTAVTPKITAQFRLANWGLTNGTTLAWSTPPGAEAVQAQLVPANLPPGQKDVEIWQLWKASTVPAGYQNNPHQCIWVQLESADAAPVNLLRSSVRRNFEFGPLSSISERATISGVGYPRAPRGVHDFILVVTARLQVIPPPPSPTRPAGGGFPDGDALDSQPAADGDGPRTVPDSQPGADGDGPRTVLDDLLSMGSTGKPFNQVWIWIVHGYRRTGQTITIGGRTREILDQSPGAFGYVAPHDGADDELTWTLSGPGMKQHAPGIYSLPVPDRGSVEINTTVRAEPPGHGDSGADSGDSDADSGDSVLHWFARLRPISWIRRALRWRP